MIIANLLMHKELINKIPYAYYEFYDSQFFFYNIFIIAVSGFEDERIAHKS